MEKIIDPKAPLTIRPATIANWQKEEVLQLARHFHKLNPPNKSLTRQYSRTNLFVMDQEDVDYLNSLDDIHTMRIYLGLDGDNRDKFTFHPILYVKYKHDQEVWLTLESKFEEPLQQRIMRANSVIVPGIFKDMILANWNTIDVNLIDDLFVALDSHTGARVRVNFYEISKDMVALFNDFLIGNIDRFVIYPGVDLNKFDKRNLISFAPVIGITPKQNVLTELISRHGIFEFTDNELFIEYSTPCPPTCPRD